MVYNFHLKSVLEGRNTIYFSLSALRTFSPLITFPQYFTEDNMEIYLKTRMLCAFLLCLDHVSRSCLLSKVFIL